MPETPDVDEAIGLCAECAYWVPRAIGFGDCQRIQPTGDGAPLPRSARIEVDNAVSGYSGRLVTSADFGCVQWDAKA